MSQGEMEYLYEESQRQHRVAEQRRRAHPKNATIKAFERIKGKSPADVQKRVAIIENAPINDVLHYRDENGQNLLQEYFSLPDEAPIVRAIIRKCGTADIRNSDGETPLHYHVHHSHVKMCTLLLDAGADVNATDNVGRTPVMKMFDNHDILKVLVDSGRCNFDARCHKGRTVLFYLAACDEPYFAQTKVLPLMKDPSNIDVTALMACASLGSKGNCFARDILRRLKDDAPLGRIGDDKGFTPFQLALREEGSLATTFIENAFVQKRYRDYMAVHYLKEAVTYGKMEQLKGILKGYAEYMRGQAASGFVVYDGSGRSTKQTKTDSVLENINYRPVGGRHCPLNVLCCALSSRQTNDEGAKTTDTIRLLLEHGANPNGVTWPVPSLTREGDPTKQNASLKSYEKPPATKGSEAADMDALCLEVPIYAAIKHGNTAAAKLIMNTPGFDPSGAVPFYSTNQGNRPLPIAFAIKSGQLEIARDLLAIPTSPVDGGLYDALEQIGSFDAAGMSSHGMQLLQMLSRNKDPTLESQRLTTLEREIAFAILERSKIAERPLSLHSHEINRRLLEMGKAVVRSNGPANEEMTPFIRLVSQPCTPWKNLDRLASIRLLHANGTANIDAANASTGRTALFHAVLIAWPAAVKLLLACGANKNHVDAKGYTALEAWQEHLAVRERSKGCTPCEFWYLVEYEENIIHLMAPSAEAAETIIRVAAEITSGRRKPFMLNDARRAGYDLSRLHLVPPNFPPPASSRTAADEVNENPAASAATSFDSTQLTCNNPVPRDFSSTTSYASTSESGSSGDDSRQSSQERGNNVPQKHAGMKRSRSVESS